MIKFRCVRWVPIQIVRPSEAGALLDAIAVWLNSSMLWYRSETRTRRIFMPTLICILGVQKDTLGSLGLSPRLAASASPFLWSCIHAQSEVEVQLCRPVFHLLSAPSGEEHQCLIYCAGCLEASEKHTSSPCCLSSALGPSSLFLCPLFTSITSIFCFSWEFSLLGVFREANTAQGLGICLLLFFILSFLEPQGYL